MLKSPPHSPLDEPPPERPPPDEPALDTPAPGQHQPSRGLDAATAARLVEQIRDAASSAQRELAERELVERAGPTLRFLCRRFTRTEAAAEDLYQETFLLALEKIRADAVQEPERLAAFLRALAKNLSTQEYRRRRYSAEVGSEVLPEVTADPRSDPLDDTLAEERRRTARRLLDQLDRPRDRTILTRYYLAEEPSTRICADLQLESDHFYRVLHRARQRFRRLWDQHQDSTPAHPDAVRRLR